MLVAADGPVDVVADSPPARSLPGDADEAGVVFGEVLGFGEEVFAALLDAAADAAGEA
ncbi:MAG: hypothetical protein LBO20_10050 [Bifidobacteriaceae bacterium]|jgi:hypothetical protein|nr:hypothetical protein [Bifidobacteriaceae bacterium]